VDTLSSLPWRLVGPERSSLPSFAIAGQTRAQQASRIGSGRHSGDASVVRAVQQVIDEAGRIDVVINNAGVGTLGVTEAYTVQQFQDLFDVNLPVMQCTGAAMPILVRFGRNYVRFALPGRAPCLRRAREQRD
jgi:NAD(P)-dependent dehydrogenase (short-subunit alcohol dehydrogenase family)